jgi:hypothetical protein
MLRAFIGLILVSLLAVLFVADCRSLLVKASKFRLGVAAHNAIAAVSGRVSAEDFQRLHALAGLCPFVQKDEARLRAIPVYHFLLTGL